jgi:Phosphopantothenate-cysteine ligase (EC 6.3.2.5)/Phosphopantothenoylcysteine decarboxylase (EC 4.1.1.36)
MNSSTSNLQSLVSKRVLLGVTGGIAAYKAAELVRRLIDVGAEVRVVMTAAAQEFITPLTMQAVSAKPVHTSLLDTDAEAGMGHIELARWADVILVAPATANFLSQLAMGQAHDLLTTLCLASIAPLAVAPAMNQAMWGNVATQQNVAKLRERGVHIFGPDAGQQACGDIGMGRMLDVLDLRLALAGLFEVGVLAGKKVLITAGPTRESIDPVRYLTNQSSGKMGYAIAQAAVDAGATVVLVSGPVALLAPQAARTLAVISAEDMRTAVMAELTGTDLFIAAAAVADYRPISVSESKLKKDATKTLSLALIENPDIVAEVAAQPVRPYTVGFAAETENLLGYAQSKLERKGLDAIVANDVSSELGGFNSDQNAAVLLYSDGASQSFEMQSKSKLARALIIDLASKINSTCRNQ